MTTNFTHAELEQVELLHSINLLTGDVNKPEDFSHKALCLYNSWEHLRAYGDTDTDACKVIELILRGMVRKKFPWKRNFDMNHFVIDRDKLCYQDKRM